MARKPIDLHKRVRQVLAHNSPPSPAADRPLAHFDQSADLRYIKTFLSETALTANQRIGHRLALVLEQFHLADPTLFDAQFKADEVSQRFAFSVTISGRVGVL